jgi:hypothetical protein
LAFLEDVALYEAYEKELTGATNRALCLMNCCPSKDLMMISQHLL